MQNSKRTLPFISGFFLIFALGGCMFFQKEKEARPAALEEKAQGQETPAAPSEAANLKEGNVYFQALSEKNPALCSKISNKDLRDRCETKVKTLQAQK